MYTLIIEDRHGKTAAEISFEQGSYTIGRVEGNDVVLPSNSVSRTHARIFVSNNKCYIDDLGSTAGVVINGVPIKARTEIGHGARIKIGDYMLYLEYKDNSDNGAGQEILKTQIVTGAQTGFKIVRVGDKFAGEEFMLSEQINSIGRTEDNYILLSDPSVSRSHAQIVNQGMSFKLVDHQSANGSFVNGKKVESEQVLQSGDELRFGNLRFVFVPATQRVDLSQYSKQVTDNRMIIIALIGLVILLFAACIIIISVLMGDESEDTAAQAQEQSETDEAFAKLNVQLQEANDNFQKGHLNNANDIVARLSEEWPNESRVKELKFKIDDEMRNVEIIAEGDALFDQKKYLEAIDKYNEVSETSVPHSYKRARERVEEAESKFMIASFNEARSACDIELTEQCISDLCDAAKAIKESGKHEANVEDAKAFLSNVAKAKKNAKLAAQASKCNKML